MSDWNPELYLKFEDGRNKPIYDLICHIPAARPERILDIGCGPGNSTAPLQDVYPGAEITGIDSSPAMIERAKSAYPGINWAVFDANDDLSPFGLFDIVFSNSVLHWLPDHEKLLPRLFKLLKTGGVFAAQIPYFFGTPIYEPLYMLTKTEKWDKLIPVKEPTTYRDVGFYYDILSDHFGSFDIWTMKHTHVLDTREDILDWYRTTGFKAFTDQMEREEDRAAFLNDIAGIIGDLYRPQKDGRFLLRFERLFFVAKKD